MTENHAEMAMKRIQEKADQILNQARNSNPKVNQMSETQSKPTQNKKVIVYKQQSKQNNADLNPHQILSRDAKDMKPADWQDRYEKISKSLEDQKEENRKLAEDLQRRQERYNKREQDYRKHIDDLQRELRVRFGYEEEAYKKNDQTIKFLQKQLLENIEGIQPKTKKLKEEQEKDIVRKFNSELSKMKKKIEERKSQKGDAGTDMKDRENELQHHLELITNIAQRIDNENKSLMKKNQELKSEYKTQENDRELLVKQLVKQKKENAKIKEEIDFYERIIEEKEDEEDLDVDRIDTVSHAQNQFQQSKFTEPKGLYGRQKNNQRSQLNSRGGVNRSQSNQQQQVPLVYIPQKKVETEEEKIKRYERVVEKLKKMLDHERKQLRQSRYAYQREMSQKTELEHLLREAVEQVKNEKKQHRIQSASASNKFVLQYAMGDSLDNMDLNQQERERVIELLLSQERVIALLYEKTFPMTSVGNDKLNFGEQNINSTDQNPDNEGEEQDQQ